MAQETCLHQGYLAQCENLASPLINLWLETHLVTHSKKLSHTQSLTCQQKLHQNVVFHCNVQKINDKERRLATQQLQTITKSSPKYKSRRILTELRRLCHYRITNTIVGSYPTQGSSSSSLKMVKNTKAAPRQVLWYQRKFPIIHTQTFELLLRQNGTRNLPASRVSCIV